jgi:malate dehydrogenase
MKISIIGAGGNLGASAAFNIGIHKLADELVMIDSYSREKLEQYVTDLTTAVTGMDTLVRAGSYEDMLDSEIVLMAAGSSQVRASRLEVLPQNLPIIKDAAMKIKQFCPGAIVITATNPVCPLNYAMYLASGFDREKVIGYSANDSVRFRMFIAQVLEIKSSRVEAMVIGEHGSTQVLLFSSVRIDGHPVIVSEEVQQEVRRKIADLPSVLERQRTNTGRTQAWATSMGLTDMCLAISRNSGEIIPCSVVVDGEYGYRGLSISVPVALGKEGVHNIEELHLEPAEKANLEISVQTLRPYMHFVEEHLGIRVKP